MAPSSAWGPVARVAVLATALKLLLTPCYKSTDFEARVYTRPLLPLLLLYSSSPSSTSSSSSSSSTTSSSSSSATSSAQPEPFLSLNLLPDASDKECSRQAKK